MIAIPTVLVLGAGSSAHVGYPLGGQLVADLCKLRGSKELDDLPLDWSRDRAELFLTHLSRSGHYSIDAFLESRPDEAPLGKYLIARELKKREVLDKLFPPNTSGWYQYLFNSLLPEDGGADLSANRLGIITFNYDRSLEAYLHEALQNRFDLDASQATEALAGLSVVHVHGILGAYPETGYQTGCTPAELVEISRQIQIIHEIRDDGDGFCNTAFERGNRMLASADRIFFLGFGFHPDNVRRFKFFTPENLSGKTVKSTSIGWDGIEFKRLETTLRAMGAAENPLHNGTNCLSFFSYQARLE